MFDGASFVLNADRSLALQMPMFEEALTLTHWNKTASGWVMDKGDIVQVARTRGRNLEGLRAGPASDYVLKNRFPGVVLGMSGGIDSAVVATMAFDALGADKVHCVMLPYAYTSQDSLEDAKECTRLIGARYDVVPIKEPVEGFLSRR